MSVVKRGVLRTMFLYRLPLVETLSFVISSIVEIHVKLQKLSH